MLNRITNRLIGAGVSVLGLVIIALLTLSPLIFTISPVRADDSTAAPTMTPTFARTPITVTVSGHVTSGTAGVSIPASTPIVLQIAHPDAKTGLPTEAAKKETAVTADGSFIFEKVIAYPGDIAILSAVFQGIQQVSPPIQLANDQEKLEIPLTLYDVTSDVSAVTMLRVQHILEFKQDVMQVLATYDYRNNSDKLYVAKDRAANGLPVSVSMPLPIGAQAIAFATQNSQRFLIGGDINAPIVQDTKPLVPGQVQEVVFSYQLPYASGTPIDQDYPFGVSSLEVLIPNDTNVSLTNLRIDGTLATADQLEQTTNNAINANRPYTQYQIKTAVKAGGRIIYMLGTAQGTPALVPTRAAATQTSSPGSSNMIQFVLLGIVVLLVIGFGLFIMRQTTNKQK